MVSELVVYFFPILGFFIEMSVFFSLKKCQFLHEMSVCFTEFRKVSKEKKMSALCDRRRGALQRPKPYPLLAAAQPGSRNGPGSRPERQPLTGKGGKVSGRRSARAAPRRPRAPGARPLDRSRLRVEDLVLG